MNKNETGKWVVFAYGGPDHASAGLPITGDAAQITANIRIDGAAANAVDDTNPTELEDGYYIFDITATESDGDNLLLAPQSSTSDVIVIAVPGAVWTRPAEFNNTILATEAKQDTQKAETVLILEDTAEIGAAGIGLSNINLPDQTMNITGSLSGSVGSVTGDINTAGGTIINLDGLDTEQDAQHLITQELIGNVASGSAALGTNAIDSTNNVAMTETLTYEATHTTNLIYHILENAGNNLDFEYTVTLQREGALTGVVWTGYLGGNGDSIELQFWNWVTSAYITEKTLIGSNGTTPATETISSIAAYTGTGVNIGKVRFRFFSTEASALVATDRLIFEYTIVQDVLGFVNGAVWIDTINGVSGTSDGIGVIGNPVDNITDAKAIADNYGLKRYNSYPGSELTLTENVEYYEFLGFGYTFDQAGYKVTGTLIERAHITGIGTWTDTGTRPVYRNCIMGASTVPPCLMNNCGIGKDNGTLTFGSAGDYDFSGCQSLVAGSGSPNIVATVGSGTVNIGNRGYFGGANYTLDNTVTLSHEVVGGGGTTITTGGADVEVRGTTRSLTLHLSSDEVVQFVGITGPITIDGTTTAEVNLYGVSSSVADSTSAAVVTDDTVNKTNINAILEDTTEIANLNNVSAAEVNAEVVDALDTDVYPEPGQGAPGEEITLAQKISYLYKAWRNKTEQTATTLSLYDDAGTTVDQKSTVADNGTTASKAEIVSGP